MLKGSKPNIHPFVVCWHTFPKMIPPSLYECRFFFLSSFKLFREFHRHPETLLCAEFARHLIVLPYRPSAGSRFRRSHRYRPACAAPPSAAPPCAIWPAGSGTRPAIKSRREEGTARAGIGIRFVAKLDAPSHSVDLVGGSRCVCVCVCVCEHISC